MDAMNLKVGDTLRCVRGSDELTSWGVSRLREGAYYTVRAVDTTFISVKDEMGIISGWFHDRFRPVEDTNPDIEAETARMAPEVLDPPEGYVTNLFDKIADEMDCPAQDDIVVKPAHYTQYEIEPITFIMKNGFDFWRGNIIKYASRAGSKLYDGMDAVDSEITDLEKVRRYAEMRISQLKGEDAL